MASAPAEAPGAAEVIAPPPYQLTEPEGAEPGFNASSRRPSLIVPSPSCGPGLDATKAFLVDDSGDEARKALDYLIECETAGDFDGFTVADQSAWHHRYYRVPLGASGGDD